MKKLIFQRPAKIISCKKSLQGLREKDSMVLQEEAKSASIATPYAATSPETVLIQKLQDLDKEIAVVEMVISNVNSLVTVLPLTRDRSKIKMKLTLSESKTSILIVGILRTKKEPAGVPTTRIMVRDSATLEQAGVTIKPTFKVVLKTGAKKRPIKENRPRSKRPAAGVVLRTTYKAEEVGEEFKLIGFVFSQKK